MVCALSFSCVEVERKMLKKKLLETLVGHLRGAKSVPLVCCILAFLKKLATVATNKDRLVDLGVIGALANLVPAFSAQNPGQPSNSRGSEGNPEPFAADHVTSLALRLLFNLSFDATVSRSVVTAL